MSITSFYYTLPERVQATIDHDIKTYFDRMEVPYNEDYKDERLVNLLDGDEIAIECGLTATKYTDLLRI